MSLFKGSRRGKQPPSGIQRYLGHPHSLLPPPPFFRVSFVLILAFAFTGCTGLNEYCSGGLGFPDRIQQVFPFLDYWFLFGFQSGVLWLLVTSGFSFLLYRKQLKKIENWSIPKHGNSPPSILIWGIPVTLLLLLILPAVLFVFFVVNCSPSYQLSHIVGACVGCFLGWWLVFRFYFRRKIQKRAQD